MEPIVYVIVHTPDGDVSVKYQGMGVGVISQMLAERGLTGTVVSEQDHEAFVGSKVAEAVAIEAARAKPVSKDLASLSTDDKLNAVIQALQEKDIL
jgi:hypothetical protein